MKKYIFIVSQVSLLLIISCNNHNEKSFEEPTTFKDAKTPVLLAPGIISTGDYDTHAALSPTGDTLYFLKCSPNMNECTICVSYKKNKEWQAPEVAVFSGKYLDVDPFVTKDGRTIYFVSNRPYRLQDTLNTNWDIWKVEQNGNTWGIPVRLDSVINSDADEYYPTMADNGTLYFGSSRIGGKGNSDIYLSRPINGEYKTVENLGDSINTTNDQYEAFIAPDESYLIFMATVPQGLKNADFFISFNEKGHWSKATKIKGPVNSVSTEWSPKVTRDGKYFYFGSTRSSLNNIPSKPENMKEFEGRIKKPGNGLGDIYYVNFSSLPVNPNQINLLK